MTDEERQKMRSDLSVDQAALAQSNAEPDPTKVICPNCAHQFGAISVADQERLRTQSDAEPQDIREALADIRALEVRLAEQKQLNELLAEELKQTNLSLKAALAQSNAEPSEKIKHKCHTCGAIYEDGATRPSQCKEYIVPLDCGYNVSKDGYNYPWDRPQSNAEPVAWAYRDKNLRGLWWDKPTSVYHKGYCIEPLYTAPPRPDASAGLIEAAEWHEKKMKKFRGIKTDSAALITQQHHLAATYFRARATDRSGK